MMWHFSTAHNNGFYYRLDVQVPAECSKTHLSKGSSSDSFDWLKIFYP